MRIIIGCRLESLPVASARRFCRLGVESAGIVVTLQYVHAHDNSIRSPSTSLPRTGSKWVVCRVEIFR